MARQRNKPEFVQSAGSPLVASVDPAQIDRHRRATYRSYETFLRARLKQLDIDRPTQWQREYSSVSAYRHSIRRMRKRLMEMLGFWMEPKDRAPVKVKQPETLIDEPAFSVRRFRFEILPGLETYAIELVPRKAVRNAGILVQHGYGVTPELACGLTPSANLGEYSYRSLGLKLVERGYHVLAVHHPSGFGNTNELNGSIPGYGTLGATYGKNRLHRLAIMAGGTLFGLDMMACSRGIDYLLQCKDVRAGRIGMYGKSQGGQSALYLAAIDQRIAVAVSSAYVNHRYRKLIGPHRATCYLDSGEEDKFFADVIRYFSDADLISMIAPRAFAVEAGKADTSVDFEKARAECRHAHMHYKQLKIAGNFQFIPHSQGHLAGTCRAFDFLDRFLMS